MGLKQSGVAMVMQEGLKGRLMSMEWKQKAAHVALVPQETALYDSANNFLLRTTTLTLNKSRILTPIDFGNCIYIHTSLERAQMDFYFYFWDIFIFLIIGIYLKSNTQPSWQPDKLYLYMNFILVVRMYMIFFMKNSYPNLFSNIHSFSVSNSFPEGLPSSYGIEYETSPFTCWILL